MSPNRSFGGVFILMLLVISTAACHTVQPTPAPPTSSASTTLMIVPTSTQTASPTAPACDQQPGQTIEETLSSPLIPRPLEIRIYLPPCYDEQSDQPYPTLYLFHGLGDSYDQWPRLGLLDLADQWLMNQRIEPFIIVMPWEQSGQDMVAAVLNVLIPHMEAAYHVRIDPEGRAMGGISRGGGWALAIAANDPQAFGAIGLHSTGVLNSFSYLRVKFQQAWSSAQPRLWIDVGERDTLRTRALEILELFDRLGLEYTWHLNPGDHSDTYWSTHIQEYLDWYTQA
ncbi:MAG: alpha/beta hydrolase-fold protein, partial [Anaerolineales bacterium]